MIRSLHHIQWGFGRFATFTDLAIISTERPSERSNAMKRLSLVGAIIIVVGTVTAARNPTAVQRLVCKDAAFDVVSPCFLPENTNDPREGSYNRGSAGGRVIYDPTAAGGNETIRLVLRGLQPDAWYLVTLQDPTGADQFSANGAECLFGVKAIGETEFCDAALVKTDSNGTLHTLVPTDSGLTGNTSPACAAGNVPALTAEPNLGTGTYTGLTVVIKNVGVGVDGTTPECGSLSTGGSVELFDLAPLPSFTAP